MKKTIICSITLQENLSPLPYRGQDVSLPNSDVKVVYPVNAFLRQTLSSEDELKFVLLCKNDTDGRALKNIEMFKTEFSSLCSNKCQSAEYQVIGVPFSEDAEVHTDMIRKIVAECEENTLILSDITYGTKDLPIVIFAVLAFAVQHLHCTVEHILYRQVFFRNNNPTEPILYNLATLLNLTTLIYTLNCDSIQSARKMLDVLLTL